jgi:nucleotide-binding universal stress UspA family protein
VVGTTKQDDPGRVFAGDDTVEVLSDAPVAVAPAGRSPPTTTLQRVGVGYNGSAGSERALAVERTLASERGARLWRSRPSGNRSLSMTPGMSSGEIADLVDAARRRLSALGDLEPEAGAGDPADELARYGRSVDLLVLGGHRPKPVDQLLGGSIAHRLADDAPGALLVLPPESGAPRARAARQWPDRPGDLRPA